MYSKEEIKDKVFLGHVLEELKKYPDNCLDCVVTSPPYYSQRFYGKEINTIWDSVDPNCEHEWSYYTKSKGLEKSHGVLNGKQENEEFIKGNKQGFCSKCGAWYGQLGCEPTPMLYINHLVQIFREMRRALKPSGLFFLNVGDTYAGSQSGYGTKIPNPKSLQSPMKGYSASSAMRPPAFTCLGSADWIKPKQLMLIPSRLAIALQDNGWLLRADIIWKKRSHLPNNVADNFDCSAYEHIFMFSKEPYYFFDNGKARRPYNPATIKRQKYAVTKFGDDGNIKCSGPNKMDSTKVFVEHNPKGAMKTNIWELNTSNSKIKHFAAFAEELVRECILPGCSREVCVECGKPKKVKYKMIVRELDELNKSEKAKYRKINNMKFNSAEIKEKVLLKLLRKKISLGFLPTCKCDVEFDKGVVFDPFMGSGTTAITAKKLGYHYSGVEMNSRYYNIIQKRIKEML